MSSTTVERLDLSPISAEIATLVRKEKELGDAIAALRSKKGTTSDHDQLTKELNRCVKQRQFLQALSKLNSGKRVVAPHRKEEGVIKGFQVYANRIVGVWVCWGRSNVPMPEDPTLLKEVS